MDQHYTIDSKTQVYWALVSITIFLFVFFQVGSLKDYEVVEEEFTASLGKQLLKEMYSLATSDPYGFLFMNLKDNTFFRSFKSQLSFREPYSSKIE